MLAESLLLLATGLAMTLVIYWNHPEVVTVSRASCHGANRIIFPSFMACALAVTSFIVARTFAIAYHPGRRGLWLLCAAAMGFAFVVPLHCSSLVTVCEAKQLHVAVASGALIGLLLHCVLLHLATPSRRSGGWLIRCSLVVLSVITLCMGALYAAPSELSDARVAFAVLELLLVLCGTLTFLLLHAMIRVAGPLS